MATNILYYILLYALVIVMRFFKLKNQYKLDYKSNWKETFDCSIEIVYTSSGFVIALLMNAQQFIPVIIVGYVLVIISSSYLERAGKDEFNTNSKFAMNLMIIFIVFFTTIFGYAKIIPETTDINGHTTLKSDEKEDLNTSRLKNNLYVVILPYADKTLKSHIGAKLLENKNFYELIEVKDTSYNSATLQAISIFNDSLSPSTIYGKKSGSAEIELIIKDIKCFKKN